MDENRDGEIAALLQEFEEKCDENLTIYVRALSLFNEHSDLFQENMRNMLVEYGILKLFGQWERFLEKLFIDYMLGEKNTSEYLPTRYINPINEEHAYRMVQNVNRYPDWTDIEKICINAQNFFENSGPFQILTTMKSTLNEFKKIRNAIAHTSKSAKRDFENLVRGKVGYSPEDMSPAKFLIEYKAGRRREDPTYYEYYLEHIRNTAKMLGDFTEEDIQN